MFNWLRFVPSHFLIYRVDTVSNTTFFIAPAGNAKFKGPAKLRIPFDKNLLDNGESPTVMFWDPGKSYSKYEMNVRISY